jgi:hypothetical protein
VKSVRVTLIHENFGQIIRFSFEQYSLALLALNLRNTKGDTHRTTLNTSKQKFLASVAEHAPKEEKTYIAPRATSGKSREDFYFLFIFYIFSIPLWEEHSLGPLIIRSAVIISESNYRG